MKEDIKKRIIEYYKPELRGETTAILKTPKGDKLISPQSNQKVVLTFGEKATTEEEAIQKGGFVTTVRDLFILLFPEQYEKHKHKFEDERTEKYLDAVKRNIGLIEVKHGYDEERFDVQAEYRIWINANSVEVGQLEDGRWVAQYSRRTDIDDYDIVKMYFKKKPNKDDIITANLIDDIEFHFEFEGYDKVKFQCWECGHEKHWLDIPGDINQKWSNYKDQYCGC